MQKRKRSGIFSIIFLLIVVAFFLFVVISKITMPYVSILGYSVFRIQTPSMQPELMVGDVILVKETPMEELKEGMVISYMSESADTNGMIITHKLVMDPMPKNDGGYLLITKGILEGAVEDAPISEKQVIGKVVTKLNVLTFIYSAFSTKVGFLVLAFPLVIFIFIETMSIVKLFRGKENDDKEES